MPTDRGRLEKLLRRDQDIVVVGLGALALAAWAYLLYMARGMEASADLEMGMASGFGRRWGTVEPLLLFIMWTTMMVAMMVPSVAPLVLTFAGAHRRKGGKGAGWSAGILLVGYLVLWTAFSVLATLAQWALHRAALLSPMMMSTSPVLGGVLLVGAGVFQLTPLKRACLVRCRSPLSFLMSEWRPGRWGTFVMGLKHGAYCVGCCWMLMAILFVVGVMNFLWVAVIAAFVLVERVVPKGELIGRAAGVTLIVAGVVLVAQS